MLSSAIKSNPFISCKESCFTRWRILKGDRYFIFVEDYCHENVLYKPFTRNISRIVADHVKFYPKCFPFGILLQKSSSWFPSFTVKYISPECHNFSFSYLHVESEPGLIFEIISSLENLRTKFESLKVS